MCMKKNPKWVNLANDLTRSIIEGRYPLNSYLPGEIELCTKYHVSRHTVRLALADLSRLGFIERRPKIGTKIISTGFDESYSHQCTITSDIDQLASTHERIVKLTKNCLITKELAQKLECPSGIRMLCFSNIRSNPIQDDKPIVWTAVYVDASYNRLPELARLNPLVLVSTLIEKEYGQTCIEVIQKISATLMPEEAARYLNVKAGTPALRILRHYMGAGNKIIEISVSYYPGDRYSLTLNMRNNR